MGFENQQADNNLEQQEQLERIEHLVDSAQGMMDWAEQHGVDIGEVENFKFEVQEEGGPKEYIDRLHDAIQSMYNAGVKMTYEDLDTYKEKRGRGDLAFKKSA